MNGMKPEWAKMMKNLDELKLPFWTKATLCIWLYQLPDDVHRRVYSHDRVISLAGDILTPRANNGFIDTYDTSFFCFDYLDIFRDVIINWRNADGDECCTSLRECLDNRCPYLAKEVRKEHNMQRIFWGELYRNHGTVYAGEVK